MSTFDGLVTEFPDIRIDRFRRDASPNARPALAYFLSHVHTDHLIGLETCRSPFIYCSPATRELLLKLEKYSHRMNFAKGIIESRKMTYRHLTTLLKPIPLETPTVVELAPGRSLQVTLFDTNHCTGAVMFLIEGNGHAILYTGDIRSEIWWVNSLIRNPLLLPYVASVDQTPLKRLDKIYLDTTFANESDRYREFPSKASGLMELLRQLDKYPKETHFYFDAWTFGYEEVWLLLSSFLNSPVHVDDYRYRVYKSLNRCQVAQPPEVSKLIGAQVGNHHQKGCLTTEQCRIHSCENGMGCEIFSKPFVRITPIVSRYNGAEMHELGAGGGYKDLNQQHVLDIGNDIGQLMQLCYTELREQSSVRDGVFALLNAAMQGSAHTISLDLADISIDAKAADSLSQMNDKAENLGTLTLKQIVQALAKHVARSKLKSGVGQRSTIATTNGDLPRQITFPYARHSSFQELCSLVEAFRPRNITPCTVDEQKWGPEQSMSHLFGHIYEEPVFFSHDRIMMQKWQDSNNLTRWQLPSVTQNLMGMQGWQARSKCKNISSSQVSPALKRSRSNALSRDKAFEDGRHDKAKRRKTEARGDLWPPNSTDHYSPASRRTILSHYSPGRRRNTSPSSKRPANVSRSSIEKSQYRRMAKSCDRSSSPKDHHQSESEWSQPSAIADATEVGRQTNRWHTLIAESQQRRQSVGNPKVRELSKPCESASRPVSHQCQAASRPGSRHSECYGRLTPPPPMQPLSKLKSPPTETPSEWPKHPLHAEDDCNPLLHGRADRSEKYAQLAPPEQVFSPSSAEGEESEETVEMTESQQGRELRIALQHETYEAVLGNGPMHWSDIGLVSVNGHSVKVKEEEL